jgi:uncharacterized protein (UPF0261 family)
MKKHAAVAIVAVSIVVGTIVSLLMDRGDIALGLVGLGGSLAVALGVQARDKESDSQDSKSGAPSLREPPP